jgi:hypothetical protein
VDRGLVGGALVAGLLAAGLPAAYVVRADGPLPVAALIALLGLLPAGIALLVQAPGGRG